MLTLLALLLACSPTSQPSRRVAVRAWDTLWQTDTKFMDSTIPSPSIMTVNGNTLYVSDRTLLRVAALDVATGSLAWRAGRLGQGPEEFSGVAALFADQDGGVGVVDIRNRRVARLNSDGQFVGLIPITTIGQQPNQMCPFGNGFLVADVWQPLLLTMDTAGTLVERLDPLWLDLAPLGIETRQALLRSDPRGRVCLVTLVSGRGFAVLSTARAPVMGRYVEAFDPIGIGSRADENQATYWAAIDAAVDVDTALILFHGRTVDRLRLIDRYSVESGAYLDTYLLPFPTDEIAAGGGVVFAIDSSGTGILALRPKR